MGQRRMRKDLTRISSTITPCNVTSGVYPRVWGHFEICVLSLMQSTIQVILSKATHRFNVSRPVWLLWHRSFCWGALYFDDSYLCGLCLTRTCLPRKTSIMQEEIDMRFVVCPWPRELCADLFYNLENVPEPYDAFEDILEWDCWFVGLIIVNHTY